MPRLRLAIVTPQFWPMAGATERAIANLAAKLVARGAAVTVVTPRWHETWPDWIDYRGATVVRLPRVGQGMLGLRRWLRNLSRYFREPPGRFDAAYVCGLRHDCYAVLKEFERRSVAVVLRAAESGRGGDCLWQLESGVGRRIKRQAMKAQAFVAPTEITRRELTAAGYPRERIHRIAGGVPLPEAAGEAAKLAAHEALESVNKLLHCPPATPAAVYTGRLDDPEGPPTAIRAWRTVVRRWPNARLWLVGAHANQSELNRRIDAAGLVGRVVIPGVFPDVHELLAAADAAVVGGTGCEGHFLLLEAMAAGLPAATRDCPENRSVLEQECWARFFSPTDGDALGQMLVEFFHDADRVKRIGVAARGLVAREYEIGKVADAHMRLLEQLVRRKVSSCSP